MADEINAELVAFLRERIGKRHDGHTLMALPGRPENVHGAVAFCASWLCLECETIVHIPLSELVRKEAGDGG